jgi:Domain of unknown function (DUF1998)
MATDGPLRRAQIIAPFGVGSLVVNKDGVSLIVCGLDNWFKPEEREAEAKDIDEDEFRIEEWRLSGRLGVRDFRLPPDYRSSFFGFGNTERNEHLTVPVLRFPQWHVCQRNACGKMSKLPLERRRSAICKEVNGGECKGRMFQVPLVAVCLNGHLNDFPWVEWVHRSDAPSCTGVLSMHQRGTGGLAGIEIRCEGCSAKRTLADVTLLYSDGSTHLSRTLRSNKDPFLCRGGMPWLSSSSGHACAKHLMGSLRSSSNIYYADTRSSIYLPRHGDNAPAELVKLLSEQPLNGLIGIMKSAGLEITPGPLRQQHRELLENYTDEMIKSSVKLLERDTSSNDARAAGDDDETEFRREEFRVLCAGIDQADLRVRSQDLSKYDPKVRDFFKRISLVESLRETRAFCGFTRIFAENEISLQDKRSQLWKRKPAGDWLPAYVVKGEGIFFEISEEKLAGWETDTIQQSVAALRERYRQAIQSRHLRDMSINPRLVLLHTWSHLLMRQLTFDCGYGTASLRERLYVSDDPQNPMAGLLIYTAAGDSEGTMGGLVRMGHPGYLEPVFYNAIDAALWCSADPVCLEIGTTSGQGPDNCNRAACHNCALLPETACEQFNRFLDRSLLIGTPDGRTKGFFHKLVSLERGP